MRRLGFVAGAASLAVGLGCCASFGAAIEGPETDGGASEGEPVVPERDGESGSDAEADVYVPPPTLVSLAPETATFGVSFVLRIVARGLLPGARVTVNGVVAPIVSQPADSGAPEDAGQPSVIDVTVPGDALTTAGLLPVIVENAPNNVGSRSNALYLSVQQPDGGLTVIDYFPDNGRAGDRITLLGRRFGPSMTLTDDEGTSVVAVNDGGTRRWGDDPALEMAAFTLPGNWHTGQALVVSPGGGPPYRTRVFNVGTNVAVGASAVASSAYSGWPIARAVDNDLSTSWFTATYDCRTASACTGGPWCVVTFASAKSIGRIAIRGNREYRTGFGFLRARLEILGPKADGAGDAGQGPDAGGPAVVWSRDVDLPHPSRDVDITIRPSVVGQAVRFVSEIDESLEPGFGELEIFED